MSNVIRMPRPLVVEVKAHVCYDCDKRFWVEEPNGNVQCPKCGGGTDAVDYLGSGTISFHYNESEAR